MSWLSGAESVRIQCQISDMSFFPRSVVHYVDFTADCIFKWMGRGIHDQFRIKVRCVNPPIDQVWLQNFYFFFSHVLHNCTIRLGSCSCFLRRNLRCFRAKSIFTWLFFHTKNFSLIEYLHIFFYKSLALYKQEGIAMQYQRKRSVYADMQGASTQVNGMFHELSTGWGTWYFHFYGNET